MTPERAEDVGVPEDRRTSGRRELAHETYVLLLALAGGAPAVATALIILWTGDYTPKVQWTLTLLIGGAWLGFAFGLRERVVYPLRTLSNLLAALREGDYSLRARADRDDALSEVMREVNRMGRMLREQRFGAVEAATLLDTVMREIDVAVFVFTADNRLKLVNAAGARLLDDSEEDLLGCSAGELGLDGVLRAERGAREMTFPGGSGRWGARRTSLRVDGVSHSLLVLSDLTRELREEELKAWQRIVRVIGHELNNSLAPIKSIAGSLAGLLERGRRDAEFEQDLEQGLAVIGSRAEALNRFMSAYARLAKLPDPSLAPVDVGECVRRVAGLETRLAVAVREGPPAIVQADADQLEQLLINLVKNAVDASAVTGGKVEIGWQAAEGQIILRVDDEGPGLSSDANLFVPFFTTKPGGSGIGLVLCRKIAENHHGTLTLQNRADSCGCRALLSLPISN